LPVVVPKPVLPPKPLPVVVPKPVPPPKPVPVVVPQPVPPPKPAPATTTLAGSAALWPGCGSGVNLIRGAKGFRRVCMTFDGGSTCEVAVEVLDLLKERGIHTTFFITGDFVQKYPELVKRMVREGHEVGNHSFTHPHLAPGMKRDPLWTKERIQRELLDTDAAFLRLVGRPMDPLWRSPFGEQTPEIRKWVEELGYRHVGWSEGADTLDWATVKERRLYRTGNAILDRLHTRMEKQDGDGLIVLMHLGSGRPVGDRPAGVLGPFLDLAAKEGWHFVTIGDYVRSLGLPPWDPARRRSLLGH
jgi:peptidoglycan/xylan/chitin deacetylase (PgdA/CDA1 family)